jgi:hypothetical protein
MTESKKYEVTFRLTMPSNVKESEYKISVTANDEAEAYSKAKQEWVDATYPRDYRVKEIASVMTREKGVITGS